MTNGIKNRRGNAFPNANFKPGGDSSIDDLRGVKKYNIPPEGVSDISDIQEDKKGKYAVNIEEYRKGDAGDTLRIPAGTKNPEYMGGGPVQTGERLDEDTYEALTGLDQEKLNIDTFYSMENKYGKFKKGKKFDDPTLKESQREMADYAYRYNNSPQCPDGDCIGYDDLGHFGSKYLEKLQANRQQ